VEAQPTALLVVIVALVLGWFAIGVVGNIRQGNAVLRWLQGGLPKVGARTKLRWLGSSVVELKIDDARPPFRQAEILLAFEPRDVPWLWLLAHLQGRRDILILRGQLTTAPRHEFSVVAPGTWTGRAVTREATSRRWAVEPLGDHLLAAARTTLSITRPLAASLLEVARQGHPHVWRLAVRREYPQFEIHLPLPRTGSTDAGAYIDGLRELARKAAAQT
jgi:hypothetical protein